ncbi:MAG: hydroxyacid dehydrogenase [Tetragenococcus halophilus]|nr:hydroxyacid dehydrogenase [Tetragenococcus koreensis]MDN6268703.1 hydroxyacid dehydrogenase [Tetragenococcus koreensis]MDN6567850.1 hydroxyacid dehydrogenase [Tetragenococcus halophilus]MDN6599764.1 hydroxyacid dehydrogenase [Tetragenococcus koreensis]
MQTVLVTVDLPEKSKELLEKQSFQVNYLSDEKELEKEIAAADVLITAVNVTITKETLENAENLKLIANIGDGYSNIDIATARAKNILITNTPTYAAIQSTAELTITILLALSRDIRKGQEICEQNQFKGWRVTGYLGGHQVSNKKIAIIGFGRVGQKVAKIANALDMSVMFVDPKDISTDITDKLNAKKVSLDKALTEADYVTLNCSANDDNYHMITKNELKKMRKEAYLINCARGSLLKETDLVDALKEKEIAGAALDVHEFEPEFTEGLLQLSNVVMTPHIGNDTYEARNEMAQEAVRQTIQLFQGKEINDLV